jgi:hypothetical protein
MKERITSLTAVAAALAGVAVAAYLIAGLAGWT